MEMDIAALSMNMAMANLQNGISVGMMKKTMEANEQYALPRRKGNCPECQGLIQSSADRSEMGGLFD